MAISLAAIAALGSVLSAGGGAIASASANNDAIRRYNDYFRERLAEHDREIAQNETETPENLAVFRRMNELSEKRYNQARATNIVAGGTDAHLTAMQEQNALANAQLANAVAERAGSVKRAQRAEKRATQGQYAQAMFGLGQQKAQTIANAAGQASKAMAGIAAAGYEPENPYDIFGFTREELEAMKKQKEAGIA